MYMLEECVILYLSFLVTSLCAEMWCMGKLIGSLIICLDGGIVGVSGGRVRYVGGGGVGGDIS